MKQTEQELINKPYSKVSLKDNDLFMLGISNVDTEKEWEFLGIFTSLAQAFLFSEHGDIIVRVPINEPFERFEIHPKQSWWNENGELLKSGRFIDDDFELNPNVFSEPELLRDTTDE